MDLSNAPLFAEVVEALNTNRLCDTATIEQRTHIVSLGGRQARDSRGGAKRDLVKVGPSIQVASEVAKRGFRRLEAVQSSARKPTEVVFSRLANVRAYVEDRLNLRLGKEQTQISGEVDTPGQSAENVSSTEALTQLPGFALEVHCCRSNRRNHISGVSILNTSNLQIESAIVRRTMKGSVYSAVRGLLPAHLRDMADLRLVKEGYPTTTGWVRTRKEGRIVDADGSPLPWYTYPAIRVLDERVPADATVFEFGMGYSTLWWGDRAQVVGSCESDPVWYRRIAHYMPPNVDAVLHQQSSDGYVQAAGNWGKPIDVLAIDGRRRVECCRNSLDALSGRGVVVWDNSDRKRYAEAYNLLQRRGFKRLDLWGMGPIHVNEWCTSIFYRGGNCLGL